MFNEVKENNFNLNAKFIISLVWVRLIFVDNRCYKGFICALVSNGEKGLLISKILFYNSIKIGSSEGLMCYNKS
jgi:hypothetical protein